jgi:cytoskeleton protein RodZ
VTVGETLTRARQERGLSVEDVTAATRIRSGLVRAIESDDYAPCGGSVYARGHIRNISRVVGVDPEPLVAEFDRLHADEQSAHVMAVPPGIDPEAAERAEPKRANWTAAMAVALVAICVLAGISLLTSGKGNHSSRQTANDKPTAPAVSTTTPAPSATPPHNTVAFAKNVTMVRVVRDTTWMSVHTTSGAVLFEGLLPAGQRKLFKDTTGLILRIGNAPAVDLVVRGHDYGAPRPPPGNGVVVTVMVRPNGKVQFA